MPGTFHQIYIQVVSAVKGRGNLISNNWNRELHKYIAGIIKGNRPFYNHYTLSGFLGKYSCYS